MTSPDAATARAAEAQHRRVLAVVPVLSIAGCASGISQRVLDPLLPSLSGEFGQPLSVVVWVITSFSLGYAISQLCFGPLGDRYGKLRVITWVCGGSSLAAVCCALAPTLPLLIGGRIFAGAMCAGLIPLSMAWLGDAVPYERRQPVIARFAVGQIIGVSLGQLLGGIASDHLGREAPFVLLTVLFALSTVLLYRLCSGMAAFRAPLGKEHSTSLLLLLREFGLVLAEPWARVVLLSVFLEGAFVLGAFAFFATHLHLTLQVSLTAAASASMLFGLGGLVFSMTARRLLQRFGEVGLVRCGGLLLLTMMGVVALVPQILAVGVACLVLGVGFYMLHSTLQTHATQMAPERRGAAVAAFALSYFVGQAVGVSAVGWALARSSAATVIVIAAVGATLTALYFSHSQSRRLLFAKR